MSSPYEPHDTARCNRRCGPCQAVRHAGCRNPECFAEHEDDCDCRACERDREKAELASDSLDNQPIGGYTDAVDELLGESMIEMERRTR